MIDQPHTAINTRSGRILDFKEPDPGSIDIDDIAGGLALAPRFGGQALHFHSVAQHAINVALVVSAVLNRPDLSLAALHHDSHEAYACDLPSPLKNLLGDEYRTVTDGLDRAIAEALGFDLPRPGSEERRTIKQADNVLFILEAADLIAGQVILPEVDDSVIRSARDVVRIDAHWGNTQAELLFKTAHEDCLRSTRSQPSHP